MGLLAAAATGAPLAVRAQPAAGPQRPERVHRIGWLSPASGPGAAARSFLQAMRERGHVEGQNLIVEYRWAAGKNERLAELAADLVRSGVELVVTVGTPATTAAKEATATIPIVFAAAGAPVQKGLVSSLSHPGGNLTGLAVVTDDIKGLEILKEAAPGITRAALLYDPAALPGRFGEEWLRLARGRSRTLKIELQPVVVRRAEEIDQVFAKLPAGTNALVVGNAAANILARQRICRLAAQRKLPTVSTNRTFADAGCLMSYGEDPVDLARRAADYVDKILKGAKPADLPIEQASKFELVINLKTAKALGLTIPQSVLLRADQVIQ